MPYNFDHRSQEADIEMQAGRQEVDILKNSELSLISKYFYDKQQMEDKAALVDKYETARYERGREDQLSDYDRNREDQLSDYDRNREDSEYDTKESRKYNEGLLNKEHARTEKLHKQRRKERKTDEESLYQVKQTRAEEERERLLFEQEDALNDALSGNPVSLKGMKLADKFAKDKQARKKAELELSKVQAEIEETKAKTSYYSSNKGKDNVVNKVYKTKDILELMSPADKIDFETAESNYKNAPVGEKGDAERADYREEMDDLIRLYTPKVKKNKINRPSPEEELKLMRGKAVGSKGNSSGVLNSVVEKTKPSLGSYRENREAVIKQLNEDLKRANRPSTSPAEKTRLFKKVNDMTKFHNIKNYELNF